MLCEATMTAERCLQEATAEATERRRLHRKSFLRKATISVTDKPVAAEPAFCRDLSRDGIGLLHQIPLETGCKFTLAIPLIGRVLEIQCETNWCRQVGDHQYFSGNTYQCVTTPQSLLLLSAALSQTLNRRLCQRHPFVRPATLDDMQGNSQPAFCRDVSRLGIGLIHRQPIAPGQFMVSIPSPTGDDIVATADLRHCSPIGLGWYSSGGQFPVEELANAETSCIDL